MIPVRTSRSNFVYRGPTPDIGDAWVERQPQNRVVYMEWAPDDGERREISAGGLIRLGIYGMEPIPPVSLGVVAPEHSQVISPDAPPATTEEVIEQLGGAEAYASRREARPFA